MHNFSSSKTRVGFLKPWRIWLGYLCPEVLESYPSPE